ncbi:MAG: ATP-grasp domain-containing protein [Bdellovibrionales bacterium]|nr:ATP-grasp domain-containing protein [Bdellovibrionales bacterium]
MRIAFTHNLKTSSSEAEAEFDTPETVAAIKKALESLGHEVEAVEVSGPASRTVARLEALSPQMIFNTAEGQRGRFREGFFPGIFEQIGVPFTGSDAYVCTLTLDKALTKKVIEEAGVRTPKSVFIREIKELETIGLRYPLILKPNFEGSSKGITVDSIVEDAASLMKRASILLANYSSGVLIEEYIRGRDIAVPMIEGASDETCGVLNPIEYVFDEEIQKQRKFQIYDYSLKNELSDHVSVKLMDSSEPFYDRLMSASRVVFDKLGVRDLGRIDYRVTEDGEVFFIEVNALPSLEPGAGIYLAAAKAGLTKPEQVLEKVLQSTCRRYGIGYSRNGNKRQKQILRVGFTFNQKRIAPTADVKTDQEAEFDSPDTLECIREAIRSYGHQVIDLEATPDLPSRIHPEDIDIVFNIAEGMRGRNRESQVPALLELLDIPYTGSDAATLALALDKGLAKRIVSQSGVPTPAFQLMHTGKERLAKEITFPAIIKPVAEGSSKGVIGTSVVYSEVELREKAAFIIDRYRQAALVEEFLPGREFTVALLGERRPRALPPMEIVFTKPDKDPNPVYSYQHKLNSNDEVRYDRPAQLEPRLKETIEKIARKVFTALDCRDFARIDLRMDARGQVNFIECNPLPGLTPGWSDMCLIAESAGIGYRELIGEIMAPAIRRFKEKKNLELKA